VAVAAFDVKKRIGREMHPTAFHGRLCACQLKFRLDQIKVAKLRVHHAWQDGAKTFVRVGLLG
jgi:hypothetical protein